MYVKGSVSVPIFTEDEDGGALRQAVAYGSGGFWRGARLLKANASFLAEARAAVPTTTPVLVACQKGLRSLSACEQLVRPLRAAVSPRQRRASDAAVAAQVRGGYANVSWLCGGFDAASADDFDTSNGKDMRYGAVGGLSGALGLTEVQKEEAAKRSAVPGWVSARCCCGSAVPSRSSLRLAAQVAPVVAFALVNWLSVTWLMQFKPPGSP